jgi:thiol:disulfide interchange protein/DsbC/DsbD-like thiol-disulfide interchange protein
MGSPPALHMHRLFSIAAVLFLLLQAAAAQAFGRSASESALIPEVVEVAPGSSFTVALELRHPDEWHSYYKNSGGVEEAPTIEWDLPEGFTAGEIQWPVPEVKEGDLGISFIYSGSPVFLIDLHAPKGMEGTEVTIGARAAWQICKQACINEEAEFSITLAVGSVLRVDESREAFFREARSRLPVVDAGLEVSASSDGGGIVVRIEGGGLKNELVAGDLEFIPDQAFVSPLSAGGTAVRDGDAWVLNLKRNTVDFFDQEIPQGPALSGILVAGGAWVVGETGIGSPPVEPLPLGRFVPILLGMLAGGLILNLMPCVFPVIGLKIMGFVQQAGHDRKKVAFHGLTFTAGVLASFGVISGILYAARVAAAKAGSSSEMIGWGYQLQNPWIVLGLMLLMFVLGLNMFGLFEIGTKATSVGGSLQSKQGLGGSFFSGVLATVVATPCSAPFLGVAIGTAIALPALQFFSAFGAMAIGLALPYLVLSAFPRLIGFLPRPGAWMESFKQGMSFLLFATAGYLLWVYAGQIGLENLLGPVFGLSAIAVAAWIYGRWNLPHRKPRTRAVAMGLAGLFAVGGFMIAKPPQPSGLAWEVWSQERVDELLEEGRPVFIDFTAKWCATCQVNKKRAYTEEVVEQMRRKGIVAMIADKTNPDPAIDAKLRELGRTAIPVNVLLVPGKEPLVTPELLSAGYLLELFDREVPVANPPG